MLNLNKKLVLQMEEHLESCLPNEGCGLVVGNEIVAIKVIPIDNILHSPTRFRMDPIQLLTGLREIEDSDLSLLAIFHSHPGGSSIPSLSDLEEFLYPDSAMIIFSNPSAWQIQAFKVKDGIFEPLPVLFS